MYMYIRMVVSWIVMVFVVFTMTVSIFTESYFMGSGTSAVGIYGTHRLSNLSIDNPIHHFNAGFELR